MKPIEVSNHTKFTLQLIFSEADKMAIQILKSISENRNKSFILFALISSVVSYSFVKTSNGQYDHSLLFIGSIISLIILIKNLFPTTISFNGALPEKMIDPYFDSFKDEILEKEYLATQIQNYNQSIQDNGQEMINMSKRFRYSVFGILISFLIFGIIHIFRLIECIPS